MDNSYRPDKQDVSAADTAVFFQARRSSPTLTISPAPIVMSRSPALQFSRRPAGFCRRRGRSLFIQDRPAGSTFLCRPAGRSCVLFGVVRRAAFLRGRAPGRLTPRCCCPCRSQAQSGISQCPGPVWCKSRRRVWPARGRRFAASG